MPAKAEGKRDLKHQRRRRKASTPIPLSSAPGTASWSQTAQITQNHGDKRSCEIHTHKPHTENLPRQPGKNRPSEKTQGGPLSLKDNTPRREVAGGRGSCPEKQPRACPPSWERNPLSGREPPGRRTRRPVPGPLLLVPTHRRCVWFSAASWGCREEAAEETRSGAPPPGHHTPRASRPGPRPPPPGAVPAPVPQGEPSQPPARSTTQPLPAAAAAASAPRAPASASCCRPGLPPGPLLRSRRCRQTRRAERRAAAPQPGRPRLAGTIHPPRAMTPTEAEVQMNGLSRTTA
ncbi:uncharacterized protein LOC144337498 [Macaca mulatta]